MQFQIVKYISRIAVILVSLPVHELAHGYCAKMLGDKTAENEGRLTLNPIKHFDPIGTIALLTVGFGWAKPVPVNIYNFKRPKRCMALVAAMGPVSNFVLALFGMCFYKITGIFFLLVSSGAGLEYLLQFFSFFVIINLNLAVFNLIPVFPLDGSRLITCFLPRKHYFNLMKFEAFGIIIIYVLLLLGFLDRPIGFLNGCLLNVCDFITYPLDIVRGLIVQSY